MGSASRRALTGSVEQVARTAETSGAPAERTPRAAWIALAAGIFGALCVVISLGSCATSPNGRFAGQVSGRPDGNQTAIAKAGTGEATPDAPAAEKAKATADVPRTETQPVDLFERARDYLDAAVAPEAEDGGSGAGRDSTADSSQAVERSLREAAQAITRIKMEKPAGVTDGLLHHPFPSPIRLRVTDDDGKPLAEVPIVATMHFADAKGEPSSEVMKLRTDSSGIAELMLPPPSSVGPGSVTFALGLQNEIAALERLKAEYGELVAKVAEAARSKQEEVAYTVTSASAKIPTGILIVDVDGRNNFVWGDATTSGLVERLSPLGFKLVAIPGNPGLLGIDDPDLLALVQNNFAGQFRRVILGDATLTQFQAAGGGYTAGASATIEVVDLTSGEKLLSVTASGSAANPQAIGAINAAFHALGEEIGIEIANRLP